MTSKEFFSKFKSAYLWGNLAAMALTIVLLVIGVKFGLDAYTHHGESIAIPNIKNKSVSDAQILLERLGLNVEVSDTGYVKNMPPDCVLEQTPQPGTKVKSGHTIYLIINASRTPRITIPDIIDNSSLREAMAKLRAMGFIVGKPEYVAGEKDWVYGLKADGRQVTAGEKVSVEARITIQVGDGMRDMTDSINYVDPTFETIPEDEGETNGFEPVQEPAQQSEILVQ